MSLKSISLILFTFTIIFSLNCQSNKSKPETLSAKNKIADVSYATLSQAQKMDIYLPDSVKNLTPVIINIHGGAFLMGDKADENTLSMLLPALKRGYAVVSINYRLSGEAKFPSQINDVKAAIRYVRANADKYHFNPNKIAVWGGSAGGHLSALAGTSGDVKELEDLTQGNPEQSSRVEAVVDWFGPIDFLELDPQFKISGKGKPDHGEADSPESKLLGKKISEVPELVKKINPETYISSDDPPFFIQHGTIDHLIPTQQSVNFSEKLVKVLGKEKVTLYLLQGADHGGPQFDTPENLSLVLDFLDKNLK